MQGEFEDTKGIIRIRKWKKERQFTMAKIKWTKEQRAIKYYTEKERLNKTHLAKKRGERRCYRISSLFATSDNY